MSSLSSCAAKGTVSKLSQTPLDCNLPPFQLAKYLRMNPGTGDLDEQQ